MLVVKVGGSLFDLPDLGPRLDALLGDVDVLLVPGGGARVEAVRAFDRLHGLSDTEAHWLALRAMEPNTVFLANLFKAAVWPGRKTSTHRYVLDAYAFCRGDGALPESWDVTSDAIAARAAVVTAARGLILLKSAAPPDVPWDQWHLSDYVDPWMHRVLADKPIFVRAVDFRH